MQPSQRNGTEPEDDEKIDVGLRTGYELARVSQMRDSIQAGLGIMDHENSELAELGIETKPEDVLAEVERLPCLS